MAYEHFSGAVQCPDVTPAPWMVLRPKRLKAVDPPDRADGTRRPRLEQCQPLVAHTTLSPTLQPCRAAVTRHGRSCDTHLAGLEARSPRIAWRMQSGSQPSPCPNQSIAPFA